jgi:uncharacterized membrane protein YhaH (DUF805 family)
MSLGKFLFSFEGRIRRFHYWMFLLGAIAYVAILTLIGVAADAANGFRFDAGNPGALGPVASFLSVVAQLTVLWPATAVGAKRFHDRGKSGWLMALTFVPYVLLAVLFPFQHLMGQFTIQSFAFIIAIYSLGIGLWFLVELFFLPGTPGVNRYGHDPRLPPPA